MRKEPNNASAYNNRGYSYQQQGDKAWAKTDYEAALKIDPNLNIAKENLQSLK